MTVRRERYQVGSVEREADAARRRAKLLATPGVIIHRRDLSLNDWTFQTDLCVQDGYDVSAALNREDVFADGTPIENTSSRRSESESHERKRIVAVHRRREDEEFDEQQERDRAAREALRTMPGVIIHRRVPDDRTWTFETDLVLNPGVDISKLIDLEGEYVSNPEPQRVEKP